MHSITCSVNVATRLAGRQYYFTTKPKPPAPSSTPRSVKSKNRAQSVQNPRCAEKGGSRSTRQGLGGVVRRFRWYDLREKKKIKGQEKKRNILVEYAKGNCLTTTRHRRTPPTFGFRQEFLRRTASSVMATLVCRFFIHLSLMVPTTAWWR